MESSCGPDEIQVSESTYNLIKHSFKCRARGGVDVKGKGRMQVSQQHSTGWRIMVC